MARDKHGFLKADALKTAGIADQYAVMRGGKRHEVSLRHDVRQGGYVCQHIIISEGSRELHAWQVGEDLDAARKKFKEEVRKLGGKA